MFKRICLYFAAAFFILALIGLFFAARLNAQEPQRCFPADQMEKTMISRHKEHRVAFAPTDTGGLVERWESAKGGWTLLIRIKPDVLCIIVSGTNWREIPVVFGQPT